MRVAKLVPGEYSLNALASDVLKDREEYFYIYEREDLLKDSRQYQEVTKYIFFESGTDWVKIQFELEGLAQLSKEKIEVDFGIRSLEVRILDLKGVNYKLRVPKTHHPYNSDKSKWITKENKITISLFKRQKEDNWFTLQKQQMIGETLDDK